MKQTIGAIMLFIPFVVIFLIMTFTLSIWHALAHLLLCLVLILWSVATAYFLNGGE